MSGPETSSIGKISRLSSSHLNGFVIPGARPMSDSEPIKPPANLYRLTVAEYDRILHSGAIPKEDKVELIEGLIVHKESPDRSYPLAAKQAMLALLRVIPPGWHVASEKPVVASKWSKPEPDLAVVKGQARDYLERDITASDVALVVKIARTHLEQDRGIMAQVYASSGIPAYWLLNLAEERIEAYSNPAEGQYQVRTDYQFGQDVRLVVQGIDAGTIPVTDVLP
jgi:Uma2 family endonuclease